MDFRGRIMEFTMNLLWTFTRKKIKAAAAGGGGGVGGTRKTRGEGAWETQK